MSETLEQVKEVYRLRGYTYEKNFPGEYYFMYAPGSGKRVRLYEDGRVWEYC